MIEDWRTHLKRPTAGKDLILFFLAYWGSSILTKRMSTLSSSSSISSRLSTSSSQASCWIYFWQFFRKSVLYLLFFKTLSKEENGDIFFFQHKSIQQDTIHLSHYCQSFIRKHLKWDWNNNNSFCWFQKKPLQLQMLSFALPANWRLPHEKMLLKQRVPSSKNWAR